MSQLSPLQQFEQAVAELVALAEDKGITLPYAPAFIVAQEQAGHIVDLTTGAIVLGEGDRPQGYAVTELGEAALRWEADDDV